MNEQIKKILNLVVERKITAEQADKLIDALKIKKKIKKLRIIIQEDEGKPILNIRVPLALAKFISKLIPKNSIENAQIGKVKLDLLKFDWQEIFEAANFEDTGELFYMETDDEGKKVIIKILLE